MHDVVPIAVSAAVKMDITICITVFQVSRFIIPSLSFLVFTADYADFTDFLSIGAECGAAIICIICEICG